MRWVSALCLLLLCSCTSGGSVTKSTGSANLTPQAAKEAIIRYMEGHPNAFVSPGRAENVKEIEKVQVPSCAAGRIAIGRFQVDLDKQSYTVTHRYSEPGGGWFEWWSWRGKFKMNKDSVWKLTEPELEKQMGRVSPDKRAK